ncbi:MAG: proprotein convertase P-domain-containing protein, partial [Pseudomonadales bacterium]|nr:proprotein convertase P-domain-containing protein [Pseudomonadales bacterium]
DALAQSWQRWAAEQGGNWKIYLDERTGVPTLATGRGIAWVPGAGNELEAEGPVTLEQLEARARDFLERHTFLLGDWQGQLELDSAASTERRPGSWMLVFRQAVDGVRVENARFDFHVNGGNLVAFGAHRWGALSSDGVPEIGAEQAQGILESYLEYDGSVPHVEAHEPELKMLALDPRYEQGMERWEGARGEGIGHRLVWEISFRVPDEGPVWTGEVDAKTGEVLAFYDAAHYLSITGGVFPNRSTEECGLDGCDFPHPMPFTNYVELNQPEAFTNDAGVYDCVSLSNPVETNLSGPYVIIDETCGPITQSATCGETFDLGLKVGTNCEVAPGDSPGNTAAARSAFFHVNRVAQAARAYLPDNTWLQNPVVTNTNVNNTCNASWGGEINMFRAGNGCGNTGENQGVLVHEWGHGFDQNDGGGYDNTSEAYADAVALFYHRDGCIGWGFFENGTCSGYGDTCLECSGVRDHDRTRRQANTPPTPTGFVDPNCPSGGGPCGRSVHCESYPIVGSLHELAVNQLPAMGYDEASAWQVAERLWYSSRGGSGGDIYTCSLPSADSCSSSSWYQQMRVADDDDGDLSNGTPHAAALFAAFNLHGIACGTESDPENQNSSSCPTLDAPTLSAVANGDGVDLSWGEVANATSYTIFRGDMGCNRQHITIDEVAAPALTYFDDAVDSNFISYYRVRPNAANPACTGPVSNCIALPDGAQLLGNGVRIVDDAASGLGNGNGRVEPGETLALPAELYNYGTQGATAVTGTLRSLNPEVVRVTTPSAGWPDIAASASLESNAPHFGVTVLPDAACGDVLEFELLANATDIPTRRDTFSLAMGTFLRDYVQDQDANIPNRTTDPVVSTLEVTDDRTIAELDVSIDISVFRSSDLRVELTSPSGTTVRLKESGVSGGTSTRYDRDRQPDGPGTMADFAGEPLQGTWTLSVEDLVSGPFPNGSTLRSWRLHAETDQPFDCEPQACADETPGAIPASLLVTKSGADLQINWDAATNADGYNVLEDAAPQYTAPAVAGTTSGATELTLSGQASGEAGSVVYYRVRGTNTCNWEGP